MLSSTLDPVEGHQIGKHPLVVKLMRGIYNTNPPKPRYERTWDVSSIVRHLGQLKNEELEIGALARKLATLLALAAFLRVSELAAISREDLVIDGVGMNFSLLRPRKTQKRGALKTFSIKRLSDHQVDPVAAAERYMQLTEDLRNSANEKNLFIGSVRPHKPVVGSTIASWIKRQLHEGGVDTQTFSAHSTRGAASSRAAARGVPIQAILKAANWSSESTFAKFYRRELDKEPTPAEIVLSLE